MGAETTEAPPESELTIVRRRTRRRRKHSTHARSRHRDPLVIAERVVCLAAAATAVSLYGVALTHGAALWRDEVSSLGTAGAPTLPEMWRLQEFESVPVAWLLMLRAWMAVGLGATDFSLRLL